MWLLVGQGVWSDLPFEVRIGKVGRRARQLERIDRQVEYAEQVPVLKADKVSFGQHAFTDKPVGDGRVGSMPVKPLGASSRAFLFVRGIAGRGRWQTCR